MKEFLRITFVNAGNLNECFECVFVEFVAGPVSKGVDDDLSSYIPGNNSDLQQQYRKEDNQNCIRLFLIQDCEMSLLTRKVALCHCRVVGVEQSREPTNSGHIWRRVRESNPGHIGGRRALSPLRQPCSPNYKIVRMQQATPVANSRM